MTTIAYLWPKSNPLRRYPALAAFALALLPFSVDAQAQQGTTADTVVQLPPLSVVGVAPLPGLGVARDELPFTVQTISADDLRRGANGSLAESLLRGTAGLNATDIQGSPFQSEITFRGYTASSLLGAPQGVSVYLDGVRVNAPFGDIVSWDLIPEAALAKIMLVPGSNPVYGLNTLGGALVLTTQSGLTAPGFSAELRAGSFGRKRADVAYGWHDGTGLHAYVAGTYFDEDGWRDHSAGHLGNLFAKIGKQGANDEVEATLLHGNSMLVGNGLTPDTDYTDQGAVPATLRDSRSAIYTWPDQTHNKVWQGSVRGRHMLSDDLALDAIAYIRYSTRQTVNGDTSQAYEDYVEACAAGFNADGSPVSADCPLTRDQGESLLPAVMNTTRTREHSWGMSASAAKSWTSNVLTAGADYNQSRLSYAQNAQLATFSDDRGAVPASGQPVQFVSGVDGATRALGIYATDTWTVLPRTFITGSLRWNASRVASTLSSADDGVQPPTTFDYRKLNPALGVVQALDAAFTVYANASQSNRVPTVIELGCADPESPCRLPAGLQSDPLLNQVTARTIEAGVRWRPAPSTFAWLSVYRTENRDDILFLRAPNTQQGYFANFPKTRNQGVDVSLDRTWGPVTIAARYSYLDATYQAAADLASGERTLAVQPGTRIAGLPRHTAKLTASWQVNDAATVAMDLIGASAVGTVGNEDGRIEDPTDAPDAGVDASVAGYFVANLRGSYRFDRHFSINAGVSNLLDTRYSTFAALATDLFPSGTLVQPHAAPADAPTARFAAPGAPRAFYVALRYQY